MPISVHIPLRLRVDAHAIGARAGEVVECLDAALSRALARTREVVLAPGGGYLAVHANAPEFRWLGPAVGEVPAAQRAAFERVVADAIALAKASLAPTAQRDESKESGPPPEKMALTPSSGALDSPKKRADDPEPEETPDEEVSRLAEIFEFKDMQRATWALPQVEGLFIEMEEDLREIIRERAEVLLEIAAKSARTLPPSPLIGRDDNDLSQQEVGAMESARLEVKRDLVHAVLKRLDPDQVKEIGQREKAAQMKFDNAPKGVRGDAVRTNAKREGVRVRLVWLDQLSDKVVALQSGPATTRQHLRDGFIEAARHLSQFRLHEAYHPEIKKPEIARRQAREDAKRGQERKLLGSEVKDAIEEAPADMQIPLSTYRWAKTVLRAAARQKPTFSTYGSHSLEGYSLDCTLRASAGPDGYYPVQVVVEFLRTVASVSRDWDWWVLYTDSRVAAKINEELGVRRVNFQWEHGPDPAYKLHLHFDLHPLQTTNESRGFEGEQSLLEDLESRAPRFTAPSSKRKKASKPKAPKP